MNILDYILIALALVAVIIGLKKGFAKMIGRVLCLIVALGGSIVAAYLLVSAAKQLSIFNSFSAVTSGWFTQFFMTTTVCSATELETLLSGDGVGVFSVLSGLSSNLFDGMSACGVFTLGEYFGILIATAIFAFVIWIVCYIAFKHILLGIRKLLCWFAKIPVIRSIDKILGVIFSVAVWYVIVIGVLYSAVIIVCANFIPSASSYIVALADKSMLFTYVHHTNFIGQVLGGLFGVDYSAIAIVA